MRMECSMTYNIVTLCILLCCDFLRGATMYQGLLLGVSSRCVQSCVNCRMFFQQAPTLGGVRTECTLYRFWHDCIIDSFGRLRKIFEINFVSRFVVDFRFRGNSLVIVPLILRNSNTYEANTQHKNKLPVVGPSVSKVSFDF